MSFACGVSSNYQPSSFSSVVSGCRICPEALAGKLLEIDICLYGAIDSVYSLEVYLPLILGIAKTSLALCAGNSIAAKPEEKPSRVIKLSPLSLQLLVTCQVSKASWSPRQLSRALLPVAES